jgi:hypothetical protein
LDASELDARIEAVYAAKTRRELDAVIVDLPRSGEAPRVAQATLWWPGVAAFHVERHLQSTRPAAYEDALRTIVPRMVIAGFVLHSEVPARRLQFAGRAERTSAWYST